MVKIQHMKNKKTNKNIYTITLSGLIFFLYIINPYYCALAIDVAYIDDPYTWDDVADINSIVQYDFNGSVKYVFDKDSGCFYFYVFYSYDKAKSVDLTKIYLGIRIENEISNYDFKINSNGLCYANSSELGEYINYSFDYVDCNVNRGTGKIVIAVELISKADKMQNNIVDCYFTVNDEDSILLIDDYEFNLIPTETTAEKASTKKESTTSSKSTTNAKITTTSKATKSQSSAASKKTTKFTPSSKKYTTSNKIKTTKSKKQKTSKFSASISDVKEENTTSSEKMYETDVFDYSIIDKTTSASINDKDDSVMTSQSKAVMIFAIIFAAAGILLISVGILGSKYKIVKTDNDNDVQ